MKKGIKLVEKGKKVIQRKRKGDRYRNDCYIEKDRSWKAYERDPIEKVFLVKRSYDMNANT